MSGFDASLLEGKDRAELAAIAEQLGQKPGARAKKADIVTLIMDLVGAERPADGGSDDHDGDQQDDEAQGGQDAGGAADAATDAAGSEADPHGEAGSDADADADAGADAGDASEAGEPTSHDRDRGRGQSNPQGRHQAGDGNGQSDGGNGNHNGNTNQGQGQGGNGNGNQAGGEGDELESGNRRRRRRGRDRDRRTEGEEQAHVEPLEVSGMVDLRDEGYGFLRLDGYLPTREDAYISVKQTRQFGLRTGDIVTGKSRPAGRNEKNPALLQVDSVNGFQAHNQPARARFDELTPVFPDERLALELKDDPSNLTARIVDLVSPIGKGTRGLIVSPPKAGKTTIVKQIVRSIEVNHPDVELIVLLVDERPEEVTDMTRWLLRGTVAASTFDRPAEEHTAMAELVIERAKRLVEQGKDVVVVLDGITRLTRAHNVAAPTGGRTLAGVLETSALFPPKRFFGAARNAEEGGSLTILATAQVDTGSRLDDVILEEFTGTANLELRLDRRLAERRVFPAIDVDASSTRHEDTLLGRDQEAQVTALRRVLSGLSDETGSNAAGVQLLIERLASFRTNAEFLASIAKG